ncbi:hypothetical protein BD779DRAFT_1471048 [Infundibulicybe gibba]|nr:hypothetical protein BD779DRAFT_1471048 [Infundibulicybe gibba]
MARSASSPSTPPSCPEARNAFPTDDEEVQPTDAVGVMPVIAEARIHVRLEMGDRDAIDAIDERAHRVDKQIIHVAFCLSHSLSPPSSLATHRVRPMTKISLMQGHQDVLVLPSFLSLFLSLRPDVLPPNTGASLGNGEFDPRVGWGWKWLNHASGHAALCAPGRAREGRAWDRPRAPSGGVVAGNETGHGGRTPRVPVSSLGVEWYCGRPGVGGGGWCSTRDAAVEC